MQARYYDPLIGRFLRLDPIGPLAYLNNKTPNAMGVNGYLYANNNPIKYNDPTGEAASPAQWKTFESAPMTRGDWVTLGVGATIAVTAVFAPEIALVVGSRFPALTGVATEVTAAEVGFSVGVSALTARAISAEAKSILGSPAMRQLKAAYTSGTPATASVSGRVIQYEPGLPASGMTLFGENGFVLGPQAFKSLSELKKTLLHELHRLRTSSSASGVDQSLATEETKAAFDFAEKALKNWE